MAERKFKYIGPVEGDTFAYGYDFPAGKFVAVDDERRADKAANNPEFEEKSAGSKKAKAKPVDFSKLSWQKIKKKVLAGGGEWTNKDAGIEYLGSLNGN